jgi:hypothetical protein
LQFHLVSPASLEEEAAMRAKESLRKAEKHLEEIEKKLKNLIEDMKQRQERLRAESLPRAMSSWPNLDSKGRQRDTRSELCGSNSLLHGPC